MDQINQFLSTVAGYVWGIPLVALLLGTGLFLTIRLALIQVRGFTHGVGIMLGRYDDPSHKGQLSHFQALSTALSATIGIGNIGGVATAIYYGGPGALFWMWVSAAFGMAVKYTSCTLATKYRRIDDDGNVRGGPMYFIELGLPRLFKPLAYAFALCTAIAAFGIGNAVQSNTVAHSLIEAFSVSPESEGMYRWLIGIGITALTGVVIIGGIKRIGAVAAYLVPIMSIVYVGTALVVLGLRFDQIGEAFSLVFYHAFNPTAATGGFAGAAVAHTITWGLKRGLFSNEAGLGSAPMAHATVRVEEPVREGLVAMLEPFIDTILICTMTGLVILVSGHWASGVNGAPLTAKAFESVLPGFGQTLVVVAIFLFAYSTVIGWSYYGEKGIEYLLGSGAKASYRWVYLLFTLLGARLDLAAAWTFADIANGLMAIPNLVALIGLSGVIVAVTRKYFDERSAGQHRALR